MSFPAGQLARDVLTSKRIEFSRPAGSMNALELLPANAHLPTRLPLVKVQVVDRLAIVLPMRLFHLIIVRWICQPKARLRKMGIVTSNPSGALFRVVAIQPFTHLLAEIAPWFSGNSGRHARWKSLGCPLQAEDQQLVV